MLLFCVEVLQERTRVMTPSPHKVIARVQRHPRHPGGVQECRCCCSRAGCGGRSGQERVPHAALQARIIINVTAFHNSFYIAPLLWRLARRHVTYLSSDVTRLPLSVVACQHGAALGSCIHAAVAAEVYSGVAAAADRMGSTLREVYQPNESRALEYDLLYTEYDLPPLPPSNAPSVSFTTTTLENQDVL